ncbi:MAG: hypothetical protein IJ654_08970 [Bacteroidales bacterium]|nr:hypothetical protein [Bacteroidales bacterium]
MKKAFTILSAALLLLAACNREPAAPTQAAEPLPDGTMAAVRFTVEFPETILETRTNGEMGDQPDITELYLAIWGAGGNSLNHWIPATLETLSSDNRDGVSRATYKAMIPLSSEQMPIHFIANPPAEQNPPQMGVDQKTLMDKMVTRDSTISGQKARIGAYWQKVTLASVVAKTDASGNPVKEENGEYIVDVTKTYKLGTTTPGLVDVPLVRNFAKVRYSSPGPTEASYKGFQVIAWTLINVPSSGYIAPYQSTSAFDNAYTVIGNYLKQGADGTSGDFYTYLQSTSYPGYQTLNSIDTGKPAEPTSCPEAMYMYERAIPDGLNPQTAVIAKIQWDTDASKITNADNKSLSGKTYWYKIELQNTEHEYFPFRRNIYYNIVLQDIIGDGEQTFDKAYSGNFFGDVSSSLETANLNEVSNNQTRIAVNQMDFVHIGEEARSFDVYFRFFPDAKSDSGVVTTVDNSATSGSYVHVSVRADDQYAAAIDTVEYKSAQDGWGHIVVTVKGSGTNTLRSKLRVEGAANGKRKIYRDITFTVMQKQNLGAATAVSTPDGTTGKNKTVTLTIDLPEGLSYSMFPLQFKIEPKNKNLSTSDFSLPVQYGTSAYDSSKNSYYFIKTINFSEYASVVNGSYQYTTSFPCTMFTTQDGSNDVSMMVTNIQGFFNPLPL